MKWGLIIFTFLFLLNACSSNTRQPQSIDQKELHVVLDIDWTIVSSYEKGVTKVGPNKIIWVEDKGYIVRDYLTQFIDHLIKAGINVSFYSGGTNSRNKELLKKIKLTSGKSLNDIAYKVLSFEDLKRVEGANQNARFSEKYKKELLKVTNDLNNVILIDDTKQFYANELEKENLIHLGPTYNYFENFSSIDGVSGEYIPKSFEEWEFDRLKFFIIDEKIQEALELMKERNLAFKEAVVSVMEKANLESGRWNIYTNAIRHKFKKRSTSNDCQLDLLPFIE